MIFSTQKAGFSKIVRIGENLPFLFLTRQTRLHALGRERCPVLPAPPPSFPSLPFPSLPFPSFYCIRKTRKQEERRGNRPTTLIETSPPIQTARLDSIATTFTSPSRLASVFPCLAYVFHVFRLATASKHFVYFSALLVLPLCHFIFVGWVGHVLLCEFGLWFGGFGHPPSSWEQGGFVGG